METVVLQEMNAFIGHFSDNFLGECERKAKFFDEKG
jgi:serine/threonine protein kinase